MSQSTPDRMMALRFLLALTGREDSTVTWQLKRDTPGDNLRLQVHHWDIVTDGLWNWLVGENLLGIAVYIMVNGGDLKGRKGANVVFLRALFVDDDKSELPPDSPRLQALPPSFSVKSKRGWHHYWLLVDGEELGRFQRAQQTLAAHLGTDRAVTDLSRVMRVPGFLHVKDRADPFLVTLAPGTGVRHTIDDVVAAYPLPASVRLRPARTPKVRQQGAHTAQPPRGEALALLAAIRQHAVFLWAEASPDEVSYEVWRGLGSNLACAACGHADLLEVAWNVFDEVSATDDRRYRPAATRTAWNGAVESAAAFGPMTFRHMVDNGLPESLVTSGASSIVHAARMLGAPRRRHAHTRVRGVRQ